MKLELVRKNKRILVFVLLVYASIVSLITAFHPYNNIMGIPAISSDNAVEIVKEYALRNNRYPDAPYFTKTELAYVNVFSNSFSSGSSRLLSLEPNTGLPLNIFELSTMPFNSEFNGGSFHHAWTVSFIQCTDNNCERCYSISFYYVDAFTGEIVLDGVAQGPSAAPCEFFNGR